MLVLLAGAGGAQAATVGLVTKYGFNGTGGTGGVVGPLNNVGDLVNGRLICPAANDNANSVPGCDMEGNPLYNDNGTPAPDDDHYVGDLIVRTNDALLINAGWNWVHIAGGAEEQVTLTSSLPTMPAGEPGGFEWNAIPGSCANPGTMGDVGVESYIDGLTIVCVRKDYDSNDTGTYAEDLTFIVGVDGGTKNGAVPGDIGFSLTSPNAVPVADGVRDGDDANLITVTASPRWNIDKSRYVLQAGQTDPNNGEKGWVLWYKFYLEVDEVSGESDSLGGYLGNESLGSDATVTFTDKLWDPAAPAGTWGGVSPNARLAPWATYASLLTGPCAID
ncbi:MAG: hypothetical protein KAG66_13565, partial [Methylococcales bacterium]|nr:hypothetical protein [Methylococcales bacterium]